MSAELPHTARRTPSAPPAIARMRLSVSSCWTSRTRLAPSAMRTLISRPRDDARASMRLATFAQTIEQHDAHRGHQDVERVLEQVAVVGKAARARLDQQRLVAETALDRCARRWLERDRGVSGSRCAVSSIRACASVTPGLRRPIICSQLFPRSSSIGAFGMSACCIHDRDPDVGALTDDVARETTSARRRRS